MDFVVANLRLIELKAIVNANQNYYFEFCNYLFIKGYHSIHDFIHEKDNAKAFSVIKEYFSVPFQETLYDGIFSPYDKSVAKWYFIAWILRDAPAQRLNPLVPNMVGKNTEEKRASLINILRVGVSEIFPNIEEWLWPPISEVMLARLEGSRRALKGNLFESLVRRKLRELFIKYDLKITISDKQEKLNNETYDVVLSGTENILMPVKTRETMGGGHAMLFTRDIFKSISIAVENGYKCFPIIIAESWGGNLKELDARSVIYIKGNPNQIALIEKELEKELEINIEVFKNISR